MDTKMFDEESRKLANEFIAQLKREGCVFKESDKDPSYYEEISEKNIRDYNKLLETGIADLLLKM